MDKHTSETELLRQTEVNWNIAIAENRVDEMAAFMDKDWIMFSGDGHITTKDAFLQQVRSGELIHVKWILKFYGSIFMKILV